MSIYAYKILEQVVKEKSFSRAAEKLNLSTSAISHTVAKLEDEYGFQLLIREKNRITLTNSGLQVYKYIQDILNSSELLDQSIAQINGSTSGTIRLGLIDSVTVEWLPDIMKRYREHFPEVQIIASENTYSKLVEDVIARELDLAIVSHSSIRQLDVPLQFIPLYEDRLLCVSPPGYQTRTQGFITPEELAELNLILPLGGNEADVNQYLSEHHIKLRKYSSAITNSSLVSMVHCGLGHAIDATLSLYSAGNLEGLTVNPIMPFGSRTLGIITHNPRYLSPTTISLMDCISEFMKEKNISQ